VYCAFSVPTIFGSWAGAGAASAPAIVTTANAEKCLIRRVYAAARRIGHPHGLLAQCSRRHSEGALVSRLRVSSGVRARFQLGRFESRPGR
jgi:hypothetical protein